MHKRCFNREGVDMPKKKVNAEKGKKGFQPVTNQPVELKEKNHTQPTLHSAEKENVVDKVKGLNVVDAYGKVNTVDNGSVTGGR